MVGWWGGVPQRWWHRDGPLSPTSMPTSPIEVLLHPIAIHPHPAVTPLLWQRPPSLCPSISVPPTLMSMPPIAVPAHPDATHHHSNSRQCPLSLRQPIPVSPITVPPQPAVTHPQTNPHQRPPTPTKRPQTSATRHHPNPHQHPNLCATPSHHSINAFYSTATPQQPPLPLGDPIVASPPLGDSTAVSPSCCHPIGVPPITTPVRPNAPQCVPAPLPPMRPSVSPPPRRTFALLGAVSPPRRSGAVPSGAVTGQWGPAVAPRAAVPISSARSARRMAHQWDTAGTALCPPPPPY